MPRGQIRPVLKGGHSRLRLHPPRSVAEHVALNRWCGWLWSMALCGGRHLARAGAARRPPLPRSGTTWRIRPGRGSARSHAWSRHSATMARDQLSSSAVRRSARRVAGTGRRRLGGRATRSEIVSRSGPGGRRGYVAVRLGAANRLTSRVTQRPYGSVTILERGRFGGLGVCRPDAAGD
jgi:hypothetical protein